MFLKKIKISLKCKLRGFHYQTYVENSLLYVGFFEHAEIASCMILVS